ncbi:uncharacterized protein MAM_04590 [Metarhizium album ARSEF 1941]|uniref:Uncharacterized protein n=1 Tax=Metarhizium album (strain ARSEF 1941) TaxID=1081103 RepID=A0A0B2WXH5_METAS|nr:uncharacterized protein MAM_04590 [Metarhizium album ARSEF 1941]KHN97575.1 hypothetical protein MAM_04590 [Metarhizium album ARSEF 1941]
MELSALNRLFCLLCRTKALQSKLGNNKRDAPSRTSASGTLSPPPPPLTPADVINIGTNNHLLQVSKPRSSRLGDASSTAGATLQDDVCARSPSSTDRPRGTRHSQEGHPCRGPDQDPDRRGVVLASHQASATTLHVGADDDAFCRTGLATCNEIKLSPSTKRLLEDCKNDCGQFLRAIKEAKAALPTGHGWEAAIATKKENADIRDLMRIYHRFECHNIYSHVVEAGFHTGTHWIREMRTVLVNKLCRDFPDRFQNQKMANKCLNWVDQGCRYREWTEMLSETSNLGYLIALPAEVPHSAYTSRCTKEQMTAATLRFKSLGIDELVEDLELSKLGSHIATKLREMTGKKRKDADEEPSQNSRKSPRLTSASGELAFAPPPGHLTTPPESTAPGISDLLDHPTHSLAPPLPQEYSSDQDQGVEDHNMSDTIADGPLATYDPFNNFDLSLHAYSEVFMSQFSVFSSCGDK